MNKHVAFRDLTSTAINAFGAIALYRDFYGSGDEFSREFERVVGHLRLLASRPANGVDSNAAEFYGGLADALERWNYHAVKTGPRAGT